VEIKERERKLSANFDKLSFREQFLERCRLYDWHLKHYQDTQRPDLKAMKQMKKSAFKFTGLGPVPGVEVGDTFDYRGEMYVVGLHRTDQAGIACVNHGGDTVACSVVVSGGYEDDVDRGDIIEYTGHGGNDYKGGKQQTKDQELKAGNLALLNSCRLRTPVRVIRGHKHRRILREILGHDGGNTSYKKYSYDGLYTVDSYEFTTGTEGYKVYKFKLVRQADQPALDMDRKVSFDGQRCNRH